MHACIQIGNIFILLWKIAHTKVSPHCTSFPFTTKIIASGTFSLILKKESRLLFLDLTTELSTLLLFSTPQRTLVQVITLLLCSAVVLHPNPLTNILPPQLKKNFLKRSGLSCVTCQVNYEFHDMIWRDLLSLPYFIWRHKTSSKNSHITFLPIPKIHYPTTTTYHNTSIPKYFTFLQNSNSSLKNYSTSPNPPKTMPTYFIFCTKWGYNLFHRKSSHFYHFSFQYQQIFSPHLPLTLSYQKYQLNK